MSTPYGQYIHDFLSQLDREGAAYLVSYNNHQLSVDKHTPDFIQCGGDDTGETIFLHLARNVALRIVEI